MHGMEGGEGAYLEPDKKIWVFLFKIQPGKLWMLSLALSITNRQSGFKMIKKMKVLTVFGTRPEAIKMAFALVHYSYGMIGFESKVCVTANIVKCWIRYYHYLKSLLIMT